ncbi:MAG: hypothetical protein KBT11_00730 [Treponema sp.]|nr:hypothetical protein [Candidatus Treponema equifaecale]
MKKICILISVFFISLSFIGCKPKIEIQAAEKDEVVVKFSTGFAAETAKALRSMSGISENQALLSENDIKTVLAQLNSKNEKVSMPSPTEIAAEGTFDLKQNQLSKCGLITKTENSISLSLGPKQFQNFYELLNEEFKSYFDLMMVPALIGEKMTVAEYDELLASMYGPTFAKDLTAGEVEIILKNQNGKKILKETVPLGELLTTTEEKVWKLNF